MNHRKKKVIAVFAIVSFFAYLFSVYTLIITS